MDRSESASPIEPSPTVFAVFAEHARGRSVRFLGAQAIASTVVAMLLLSWTTAWWPLASMFCAVSAYSAWGLADAVERRGVPPRLWRPLKFTLAGLATVASLLGVTGAGLALYTGDAPSPKGACYEPSGRAYACDATGRRRSPSLPPEPR